MSALLELMNAIEAADVANADNVLKSNPSLKSSRVPGHGTFLHYAARFSQVNIVKYLIEQGFDVNSHDDHFGISPLVKACDKGNVEVAEFLISQGAILDVSDSVRNPLWAAVVGRSLETVKMLLDAGVDTSPRYKLSEDADEDLDAVAFAILRGEGEIARLIALSISGGDEIQAQKSVIEGRRIAEALTH